MLHRARARLQPAGAAGGFTPRRPEETVLYGVVSEQLETFLTRQRRRERPVPRFVERELRSVLDCGMLAHGFLRVHSDACGKDLQVFVRAVLGSLRRRARDQSGFRRSQCGAVTFVQHFGGALRGTAPT